MKSKTAQKIIEDNKSAYNSIASDFDNTRKRLWPSLYDFLQYVKKGDQVLDVGCGNGRLIQLFKDQDIKYVGLDNSQKLLDFASRSHPEKEFVKGDILKLPFEDRTFDIVLCVAVLHHIPGKKNRSRAMKEMKRVLKPGGYILMTNWDRYFNSYKEMKYLFYYTFLKLIGLSKMEFKDVMLPWANSGKKRFYHCFTFGELKKLFKKNTFEIVERYKTKERWPKEKGNNMVIVGRK